MSDNPGGISQSNTGMKIDTWVQIGILAVTSLGIGVGLGVQFTSGKIGELETQNYTLQISNQAKLPELLSELKATSEELRTQMETLGNVTELNKQLKEAKDKWKQTEDKLKEAEEKERQLLRKVEYYSQIVEPFYKENIPFYLEQKKVAYLFGRDIPVVWQVSSYKTAKVTVNNEEEYLDIGNFVAFKYQGEKYKLVLDVIEREQARFILLKDLAQ